MSESGASLITVEDFLRVLHDGMPSAMQLGLEVVSLERGAAHVRLKTSDYDLRPGGTVAGPTLFSLADLAMYAAVLSAVGSVPLAVTTDATVHFLRKPKAGLLNARAKLLTVGRRLVVGEVVIEGESGPVVHAVMTYALPQT